jgi:hypothetical protein
LLPIHLTYILTDKPFVMRIILHLTISLFIIGCASTNDTVNSSVVQFALIGNTYPESPFWPINPDYSKMITSIIKDNPVFIIHTGNTVYSGQMSNLREIDIVNQLNNHAFVFEKIRSMIRYVPGEYDLFAGSSETFTKRLPSKQNYSFSYGHYLFIILDSSIGAVTREQTEWMREEIESYDHDFSVFVCTYYPLFSPKNLQVHTLANAIDLHQFFITQNVKGVISGCGESMFTLEVDSIQYANAGTVPSFKPLRQGFFRYYNAKISRDRLLLQGRVY